MDIVARLKVNGQNFSAELGKVLGDAERRFGNTGNIIGRNLADGIGGGLQQAAARVPVLGGALSGLSGGALIAAAGLGAVSLAFASGVAEAEGYEKAIRQVDAVLKATGNTTGYTRDQLIAFANDMEGAWAVPAEEIMKAEQVLASFDGVAGDVFKRAIVGAADMSAVFGGDLSGNTEKLGTVLQNLAQGEVAGLTKGFKFLGVETLDTIAQLAEVGKTAEAQQALLAALEKKVGGAKQVEGEGLSGAFFRLSDAIGDSNREVAMAIGLYATLVAAMNRAANAAEDYGKRAKEAGERGDKVTLIASLLRPGAGMGTAGFLYNTEEPLGAENKRTPNLADDDAINLRLGRAGMSYETILAGRSAERAYASAEAQRRQEQSRKDAEAEAKKRQQEAERLARQKAKEIEDLKWDRMQGNYSLNEGFSARYDAAFEKLMNDRIKADQDREEKQRESIDKVEEYRKRKQIEAIEDVADLLTGMIGGKAGRLLGDLISVAGGGRASNPAFGILFEQRSGETLGDVKDSVDNLGKDMKGIFSLSGEFTLSLRQALAGASAGYELGSMIGGGFGKTGSRIAGGLGAGAGAIFGTAAVNAMAPLALASAANEAIGKVLGFKGGPLGVVGALLGSTKWGASSIGFGDGGFSVGAATGNSGGARANATASANSVIGSLESIIAQLGGSVLSAPTITIGQRHGDYRVNTSGTSLKIAKGAMEFDKDQQAAVEYAIKQMLAGAVIDGISEASKSILKTGKGELEELVRKASLIESIPKSLKARLDPVGAAIDAVNDKWKEVVDALHEGGAGAAQMAEAQKLYNLEMEDARTGAQSASAGLKAFRDSLEFGASSPLSPREQEEKARAALQPYLDKIDLGSSIDQGGYQEAAQRYLDIAREIYGSTGSYFDAFNQIQAATSKAIGTIDNAVPFGGPTTDPFAAKTAAATQSSAELLSQQSGQLANIEEALWQIAGNTGGATGSFIGRGMRGF